MTIRRKQHGKSAATVISQKMDVPSLLQHAQECIDKMEFTKAIIYLKDALNKEPENITVIDMTAATYMELGNDEEAFPVYITQLLHFQLLVKSAQNDPDHNFEKWMYLGQLQVVIQYHL